MNNYYAINCLTMTCFEDQQLDTKTFKSEDNTFSIDVSHDLGCYWRVQ